MPVQPARRLIVGISGATGVIYGVRALELLRQAGVETHAVASKWALRTLLHETRYTQADVQALASRGYAAASEETVLRFFRAAFRGLGRFVQDEALSVDVVARYSRVTMPDVLAAAWEAHARKYTKRIPYTTESAVQMTLEELALSDPRAQTASPEAFYDNRFVRELDQAQFFTALYPP